MGGWREALGNPVGGQARPSGERRAAHEGEAKAGERQGGLLGEAGLDTVMAGLEGEAEILFVFADGLVGGIDQGEL